jgi:hypothetical protein
VWDVNAFKGRLVNLHPARTARWQITAGTDAQIDKKLQKYYAIRKKKEATDLRIRKIRGRLY